MEQLFSFNYVKELCLLKVHSGLTVWDLTGHFKIEYKNQNGVNFCKIPNWFSTLSSLLLHLE